ncbi:MAG: hypothetical protein WAV16_03805 [Candidatus Moraniibacteriota bacterium]
MEDNLKKSILNTICYYDVLNYPLTVFEIWKHLLVGEKKDEQSSPTEIKLKDVMDGLADPAVARFIDNTEGLYFLKGRRNLVRQRIIRNKISALKTKRMQIIVSFLRLSPFVRMVLVTGRLAMKNARPQSDWDVLVVLKENRIWIGRTFITALAHFLGKRRHHDKIANRLCFNYFITTNSLEIRNKDFYSANEYFFCFPLYDGRNYFHRFQVRNSWIKKYKPNYYLALTSNLVTAKDSWWSKTFRAFGENILDWDFLEKYLAKWEVKKIKENPKTKGEDSWVDADSSALIFLPNPQGPKVFEKFKNKLAELNL